MAALAVAISVLVAPFPALADDDGDLIIRFPGSPIAEVRKAQQALVEAWAYTSLQFFDPTFNGMGLSQWKQQLQQ